MTLAIAKAQRTGIEKLPFSEYRKRDGLNKSTITELLRSPLHAQYANLVADTMTPSKLIGVAIHCAILEPNDFERKFKTLPEGHDGRTKEGKARIAEYSATGATVLSFEQGQQVHGMASAIAKHPLAFNLLVDSERENEMSMFWQRGGCQCKARWDTVSKRYSYAADLKSCTDASLDAWRRTCVDYGYHIQAAHYLDGMRANGLNIDKFYFVCVESSPPHAVAIFELDEGFLSVAEDQIGKALILYRQCMDSGLWPGYPQSVQNVLCPSWLVDQHTFAE